MSAISPDLYNQPMDQQVSSGVPQYNYNGPHSQGQAQYHPQQHPQFSQMPQAQSQHPRPHPPSQMPSMFHEEGGGPPAQQFMQQPHPQQIIQHLQHQNKQLEAQLERALYTKNSNSSFKSGDSDKSRKWFVIIGSVIIVLILLLLFYMVRKTRVSA